MVMVLCIFFTYVLINHMSDILMQKFFTSAVGLSVINVKDFTYSWHNSSTLGYFIPKLNL